MMKIVKELVAGKYKVLALDGSIPLKPFKHVRVAGEEFVAIIPYDLRDSVAILNDDRSFIGKEIEFV